MEREKEKSVWCAKREIVVPGKEEFLFHIEGEEEQNLRMILQKEAVRRQRAFINLMEPIDGGRDLDFVSNFTSYFHVDVPCICDELMQENETERAEFVFNIGQLLAAGKVGEAFLLQYNGHYLILKSIKNVNTKPYLSLVVLSLSTLPMQLKMMNPGITKNTWIKKQTSKEKLIAIGGDNFSNQTCLHMILNTILKSNPNYVYQYDAFYCGNNGYNVTEFATQGDLSKFLSEKPPDDITEPFLQDLLTQVIKPLSILKSDLFSFVHADLKAKNIFVSLDKDDNPIYRIADYDKSSIYWKGLRFYNNSYDYRWNNIPFEPQRGDEGDYYVLDNTEIRAGLPIQVYTMHNPYGFYLSFDIYTFFYSLMMEPVVWNYIWYVHTNKIPSKVYESWKSLWYSDQFANVMSMIQGIHVDLSFLRTEKEVKDKLASMRSIRNISNLFYYEGYKLKVDLKSFYKMYGLKIRGVKQTLTDRTVEISRDGHVCVEACRKSKSIWGGNKCKTNTYSSYGTYYEEDRCDM